MEFRDTFEYYLNKVNNRLNLLLEDKTGKIYDAMRYSLYAGGKRIRPVLALACCDSLNGDIEAALCYGCAIEMIHTYSLIHDDLPCMDDDDLRRGKPTNHIVFGEDVAVLAGDALLNFACESILNSNITDSRMSIEALKVIYSASGADGMIGGQVLDMEAEKKETDVQQLVKLHRMKTGALICASASVGAISAGKDKNTFSEYASSLGLAFQIRDDILDIESDSKTFGKPVLSDEKNNKTTYVKLFGIDGAKQLLKEETDKAIESIEFLGEKGRFLKEFATYLLNREN
ncbi:MAG: polyprenyl synthetase family protein [Ruminococcaceae bacterium]|nr:polyprenyl synthetase family protein [Oscillospiraceae bacterium]